MQLENQVSSLELSKKLKELGVKQKSLFYWHKSWNPMKKKENDPYIMYANCGSETYIVIGDELNISAFTVAELGEMLPGSIDEGKRNTYYLEMFKDSYGFGIVYRSEIDYNTIRDLGDKIFRADTEADARAKMLIYLLKNKLIKI